MNFASVISAVMYINLFQEKNFIARIGTTFYSTGAFTQLFMQMYYGQIIQTEVSKNDDHDIDKKTVYKNRALFAYFVCLKR